MLPLEPTVREVTLTRLSGEIARLLAPLGRLAVSGEVHRPQAYRSGTFFTLKDRVAAVTVRVPGPAMRRSRVVAGERVQVVGRLEWQADRGSVTFVAEEVLPIGAGAVAAMVEAARRALAADGLLDRPRRRLPLLPRKVGVVCGNDAAVRHDVEVVAAARFPGLPIVVQACTVTGPGAAASIEAALAALLGQPEVDVVVLARGGGDATQLLPWSDEQLCRAVAAAPVPVVAAIGHEGDRPLVDEVADVRCGTPSMAAAAVVPSRAELQGRLDAALAAVHPSRAVERAGHRLAACRFREAAVARHERAARRLAAAEARLADLGPQQVLRRGYAVVRDEAGAVVRDAAALAPGQRVEVQLAAGRFRAVVEEAG